MIDAPASTASQLLSICSATEIGTAGLSALPGSEPVIAQHRMQGAADRSDIEEHRFPIPLQPNDMAVAALRSLRDHGGCTPAASRNTGSEPFSSSGK